MDPRPILTTVEADKMVAAGKKRGIAYVEGTHYVVDNHCTAKWGTRTCIRCFRFIKRRDQRCR